MESSDEILLRMKLIESKLEKIHMEIIDIKRQNDEKSLEQFHVMTRLENIADFIKDRYDVVVEEKEEFNTEKMENDFLMWYSIFKF